MKSLARPALLLFFALACRDQSGPITGPDEPALANTAALKTFSQVATGPNHTCAITTDDRAWCWGQNDYGQLGTGDFTSVTTPVPVAGALRFTHIQTSYDFTCALATDDRAYCWGLNQFGQLGDGTTTQRLKPKAVAGGRRFRQLATGFRHACAVTLANVGFCWG